MNCPKCDAPLKPGAKFCTHCGTKIQTATPAPEPAAAAPVPTPPAAPQPSTPQGEAPTPVVPVAEADGKPRQEQLPADVETATGRIYWNIQTGQVARLITERELEQYGRVRGIIVPEGTTAYVRAGGQTVASISGGTYDFEDRRSPAAAAAQGVAQSVSSGWQTVLGLFRSKRKRVESEAAPKAGEPAAPAVEGLAEQQRAIFAKAKAGEALSIIVLVDRAFPLLVGAKQPSLDAYATFRPMKIQTKHLEVEVGLNAYFKIADHETFIRHYLTGKTVINTAVIVDEIADSVRSVISDVLRHEEVASGRLDDAQTALVKSRLQEAGKDIFFGLSLVRIVELSAKNEDLQRFADLSREMYLSEQELDYLRRTGDFKNRLAAVQNAQQIAEARNAQELRAQLDAINRDQLLQQDEMDKFVALLENEKILRNARTEEERNAALAEIEKTQLVRQADLEVLRTEAEQRKLQAGSALRLMQLKDTIEYERVRMQGENEQMIENARVRLVVDQMERDQQYEQRRRDADFEFEQRRRNADLAFEEEKRRQQLEAEANQRQMDDFERMARLKEQMKENERRHELELKEQEAAARQRLVETQANLTPEQLLAMQGGEAAVEYARSLGARHSVEAEREANARYEAERQRNQEMLYGLMNRMVDAQAAQAGGQASRLEREQARADQAYDRSMNYITRQPQGGAAPQAEKPHKKCPSCGAEVEADAKFCDDCGEALA